MADNSSNIENGGTPLDGTLEVDETFVGGKGKNRKNQWVQGVESKEKEILMGMVQREGKVYIKHIPNTGKWTLLKQIQDNISPKARIFTDEYRGYIQLSYRGYTHNRDLFDIGINLLSYNPFCNLFHFLFSIRNHIIFYPFV